MQLDLWHTLKENEVRRGLKSGPQGTQHFRERRKKPAQNPTRRNSLSGRVRTGLGASGGGVRWWACSSVVRSCKRYTERSPLIANGRYSVVTIIYSWMPYHVPLGSTRAVLQPWTIPRTQWVPVCLCFSIQGFASTAWQQGGTTWKYGRVNAPRATLISGRYKLEGQCPSLSISESSVHSIL